jgi:hypothetical protein
VSVVDSPCGDLPQFLEAFVEVHVRAYTGVGDLFVDLSLVWGPTSLNPGRQIEMNNPMRFKHGHKQVFVSTRTFTMGNDGVTIPEGSEIEFDGTFVSYAGLAPTMMPQLRGAIRAGWLTPIANYDPDAPAQRPQPAGMQMRSADGGNPMNPKPRHEVSMDIDAEEREVGNVQRHAAATREGNRDNYRRRRTPRDESTAGDLHIGGAVEVQDEVEVPGVRFQTLAGEKAKQASTNIAHAGQAISKANKVKIKPGQGRTREELLRDAINREGLTQDELAEYQEELDAMRMSHGVVATPEVVGHIPAPRAQQREGFDITNSVGGGTETVDLGGTGLAGADQETVTESEGIKFTNTNGPKKGVRLVDKAAEAASAARPRGNGGNGADDAMCRMIARSICPDFPENYVFTDPTRKKIARLQADYDDRPDVIRAVAAAETDGDVKRRLVEEFPEAFG